jgi:hypothetical protein
MCYSAAMQCWMMICDKGIIGDQSLFFAFTLTSRMMRGSICSKLMFYSMEDSLEYFRRVALG